MAEKDFMTDAEMAAASDPDFMSDEQMAKLASPSGGFMASALQSVGATIKGAGTAAADFLGAERDNAVSRYGQSIIDANPTAVQSLGDIANKPLTAVAEATGNAAGSMGGMLGARALGMGITAAAPLAGPAAPIVAGLGQAVSWLAPAAIAALPSFGSIREQQILTDPANENDAKSIAIATLGAGAVGAIETAFGPQQWALSAMTKEGRAALAEKFAKLGAGSIPAGIAKGAALGGVVEGSEELAQNPIEQAASYQNPLDPKNVEQTLFSGAMGAIGGGIMGGGFGAVMRAPSVDDAIAAADASLQGAIPPAAAAIDEFKSDAMPLSPVEDMASRLAELEAPRVAAATDADMAATLASSSVQPVSEVDVAPPALPGSNYGLMSVPSVDEQLAQRAAAQEAQQTAADAAVAAEQAQVELMPGEVQDVRTMPIARDVSSPPSAPDTRGDAKLAEDAVAVLRKSAEQRTPADTALLGMARRTLGDTRYAALEQYVKGPALLTREEQRSAAATATAPISVQPNDNGVPIVKTQTADQTAAIAAALRDAGVKVHTVDGGNLRLNKNADAAVVQNVVSRVNTQFTQPRGQAAPAPTQGERDGQGLQGQETAEAVAVKEVFGPDARLRTTTDVRPGEPVTGTMRAALVQLGRLTGTKVVFFDSADADGATRSKDGNTVYINVRAGVSPLQVMGHEVTHVLKRKHRQAWAGIKDAVQASTDNATLLEFARDYWSAPQHADKLAALNEATLDQRPDAIGVASTEATVRDFLLDEMISDLGGGRWGDPAFWENVFQKIEQRHGTEQAKGIIQRLVAAVKEMVNKLIVAAKTKGFAEFRAEGMVAQRVTPAQLQEIRSAIEDAYATFISAKRRNEPAGYTPGQSATAAGSTGDELEELEGSRSEPRVRTEDTPDYVIERLEPAPGATTEPLTPERLVTLRRAASLLERPRDGLLFRVTEDGAAIATGEPDTAIPKAMRDFAKKYGLRFEARRVVRSVAPQVDAQAMTLRNNTEPMPGAYREAGALYAAEMGSNQTIDRTGSARFSPRRTSDVGHKRTKSGDYVGAPPGMTSAKLGVLRTRLRALATEGKQGRMWYEESGEAILEAAEGNIPLAEKIAGLLAIYSPSMLVSANTTVGLKALYQWMNGQPIDAKTSKQDEKAQAWMDGTMVEEDALQIKTGNFFRNLMRKIDEPRYGFEKQGATIDMWMARVFGYNSKEIGSEARYGFAEREVKRLAAELGWEPQQVQAALWVAIKSRIESIADAARTYGQEQGWLKKKVSSTGNISWIPINAEAREKYESHMLKLALATSPDPKGLAGAAYNFGTAIKERVGQISWEAMPGRTSGTLPGIFDAPLEQQLEYLVAMDAALRDENGNDIIAARLGLPVLYTNMGPSAWEGAVGAGAQTTVAIATDRSQGKSVVSVNQNARALLNAYSAIKGYVLSQEAVVWHYPVFTAAKRDANGIQIDIGRDPTTDETRQLYQGIADATGRTDWAPAYVPGVGWRILNFDESVPNPQFAKFIISVLKSLPDTFPASQTDTFKSDGDYISNDWKENPNGEGYRSWISGAGRSDLQGWVEGDLRDRTRRVEKEFAERYGWGRPDATSSRPTGESVASESPPRYGEPVDRHAVSVTGVHYSREQRSELSSAYFGTGMKGQERLRVSYADDPRIKRRLYFYANTGRGVSPESDVGIHAHTVGLDNVYDMDVDPLKLYVPQRQGDPYRSVDQRMNDFESAVIDAGYDGYMTRDFGVGGAVVLLGDHAVPVQYEGAGARPDVAMTPAPQYDDLQQLKQRIAANRALPSGQMSGADWKRLLMAVMPEVDPRWLNNSEMYYKGDLLKGAEEAAVQRSERRLAPNGQPSKLTERQWLQVRTPEFKAWFGDWEKHARADNPVASLWSDDSVSKIVDENGEPLVVYHGTQQGGFDVFRPEKGGKHRSPMLFATADAGTARSYSGRPSEIEVQDEQALARWEELRTADAYGVRKLTRAERAELRKLDDLFNNENGGDRESQRGIYHLFLNIRNPNEADFEGANWDGQLPEPIYELQKDGDYTGEYAYTLEDAERALKDGRADEYTEVTERFETTNSVAEEALRLGNDGAIIRNVVDDGGKHGYGVDPSDVFVFFDSNQVKSATQNTGAFSRTDDSILRSESRTPTPWYYSELSRAVTKAPAKLDGQGAAQWVAWIKGNASKLGVKKEEIEWSGVMDWLGLRGKERTTREDVAAYLEQGGVQVQEVVQLVERDPGTTRVDDAEIDAEIDRIAEAAFGEDAAPIREPGMRPTTQQPGFEITDTMRAAEIPLFSERRDRTNLDTANRRMSRFIDAFVAGDVKSNDTQILGPTPVVMRAVGAPDLSMEIDGVVLEKVLGGKHKYAITPDMMKQLPDGIYDPIALFSQPEGGVRAITELTTEGGSPVVVGVHFTVASNRMKVNRIATVFEYERAGERFMEQAKNLRYVRNEEALKSSTTPATPFRAEVVQKARELGADFITEADLVKLYQPARYSPARGAITGQTIQPSWSFAQAVPAWDNFVRQMQDKQIDMKRIVAEIRKAGVAIKEQFDPYLQEILFHGRAAKRVEDFTTTELKPLFIEMQARGIEQREFDDYLWARHATERNAQIARVNTNMPDDGSGLTNQQAADILAGQAVTVAGRTIQLNPTHMAAYASLEARVRRITDNTLNLLVSSGLESQETVDAWRNAYKNYAPLMRDMESDDNFLGAFSLGLGTGQGFSVRGSSSKRATGSERAVVDVLANIAMQRERAITRAEKNRVAQAVYGLALTAPNTDFWLPVNPDARDPALQAAAVAELVRLGLNPIDAQNIASEPVQTYTDPRTGMVSQRINPMLRGRADVLALRVNGKDRYVFFSNDERAQHMVRNLKNLDDERLNGLMQAVAPVTRYFASINTQYNPVFGLTNGIRDLGTGMLNIGSTPIKGQRAKVLKYAASALRGIFIDLREHRAGRQPQSQWALEFEEFQKEGGRTGYRDMFRTSEDRAKAIADEIKKAGAGESSWKVFSEDHPVGGWLSDYNTAIENAVRLAAYKAAKEDGHSPARAAEIAKNLTVNFNKKGQIATQAGALYAFFNAAVQGAARVGQTMVVRDPATGKWDLTATGKKIAYGGILLGSLQALMLAAAGYDDEEPPQFMRERNLILPLGYRGKYLTLPMPLGFHVLPNIGRVATELLLSGGRDPHKRLAQLVGTITDAFNPLGSSTPLQMLTPSVVDPLAALAENKDWSGKSIYKEDFNKLEPTAGWTRKKDTASDLSQWLSRSINYVSGGGKYGIGLSSPTPDQLDYLIGQATGGVGRESIKLWQSVKTPLSGEELPMYKIPVVGRFVGETTGQASEMSKFYENLKRIGEHDSALKEMKRARDTRAYIQYLKDNPDAQMIQLADRASRDMALLKRQKREAVEKGDKERVKLIEMQITGRVRQYNKKLAERQ